MALVADQWPDLRSQAWLDKFLTAAGRSMPTAEESQRIGRALCAAAVLAVENDDYAEAVRLAGRAMRIFEPLDPGEDLAFAATVLGSAHRYLGERAEARRSFQTALDLRAAVGDRAKLAVATNNMALIEIDDGNLGRARELLEQNLIMKRQLGEPRSIAIGLVNLADVLIKDRRWQAARASLAEAAELAVVSPRSWASSCAARATSRPASGTGSRRSSSTPTPSPPLGSAAITTT